MRTTIYIIFSTKGKVINFVFFDPETGELVSMVEELITSNYTSFTYAFVKYLSEINLNTDIDFVTVDDTICNVISGVWRAKREVENINTIKEIFKERNLSIRYTNKSDEVYHSVKGQSKYFENPNKFETDYIAYTDGASNNLSPYGECGSAYIILQDGKIIKQMSKGFLHSTNNRVEMLAIISAVNSIPEGSSIRIVTDSKIAINAFTYPREDRKNYDLIKLFLKVSENREVIFEWVKGHSGVEYNEMVDEMAQAEREKIRKENNIPVYSYKNSPKVRKRQ